MFVREDELRIFISYKICFSVFWSCISDVKGKCLLTFVFFLNMEVKVYDFFYMVLQEKGFNKINEVGIWFEGFNGFNG